ncbi:MAG TPA: peptidylprolyl isomerase [Dongiaceae bacterium]|nr:peptidylprolyl isomerase [Dongiaceae bacterium]
MSYSISIATRRRSLLLSTSFAFGLALATLVAAGPAARADDTTPAAPAAPAAAPAGQLPGADAPAAKPIDPKTVVARVNGKDITRQDVIDSASNLPPQIKANIDMVFPQLTDRLIGLTLITSEGRSENLQNDPEVKAIVQKFEDEAIRQVFLTRLVKSKITDDAVKAKYDQNLKDHPPQDEVKVAHILVKTEKEANDILAELKKGTDFAKLAKDKSIDKGSAVNGGDLGMYFTQNGGEVVQPFADAAFTLKNGEVTQKPVQTQFGWHVIKLEDRRKQTPPSFDEQKDQLRQQLAEDMVQNEVKDLRAKAKVETFNPDGTPVKP